jgi:hypothetical protein
MNPQDFFEALQCQEECLLAKVLEDDIMMACAPSNQDVSGLPTVKKQDT